MLRVLKRVVRPDSRSWGRRSVTEWIQSNGVKLFRGVTRVSPTVAEYWLEATERIINDIDCTLEQNLKGAIYMLRDEAYQWWLSVKKGTQPYHLSWDYLKTSFQAKYVGTSSVDAHRREFMNLMQDGLRDSLRVLIASQREREFVVLMDKAKIAEEVKREERQNRDRERGKNKRNLKPSDSAQRPKKQVRPDGTSRVGVPVVPTRVQPCSDCGRRHLDECWKRLGACLDYIGSTHSYIASSVSGKLGIPVENTLGEIFVLSLLGQSIRENRQYRNVPLEVQGVVVLKNLIKLSFGEFDLILGMDWLVEHQGMKYIWPVSVSVSRDSSVGNIRTVRKFLDVFPDKLPGLPLNWEVEFGIKLLLNIAPVPIALYRMAPKELTELKAQL
ncbi:uncharacterized protein [Gossypium hirsutum]|uniref:Retrotransposon gag domain-containing protein n=1 Tax=Gossypium hirsutum TaxID=3635 RepID=A0A1U8PNH5_GOSHI|nr:uncharacterized protein LOC107960997 [Gossypium hirsutum]